MEVAKGHYGMGDAQRRAVFEATLVIPHYYTLSRGSLKRVVQSVNQADGLGSSSGPTLLIEIWQMAVIIDF